MKNESARRCNYNAMVVRTAVFLLFFMIANTQASWAQSGNRTTILAQKLVDEIHAKYAPALVYIGLHAVPPNSLDSLGQKVQPPNGTEMFIIAATDPTKIGKYSGLRPWLFQTSEIELKGSNSSLLEPLHDRSGQIIGVIIADFQFGDDQASEIAKFRKLLDKELSERIPSRSALFEQVPAAAAATK
jgi:hypothetical protein